MPLDCLHSLVESLKRRIQEHGTELRGSEMLTRYTLIDPLLRELGWDTADPTLVVPEYKLDDSRRADYALLDNLGNPAMMVEAKGLGKPLRDDTGKGSRTQALLYCLQDGIKHFALTDGQCWEIYQTLREGNIDEKRIVEFDLIAQSATEVCLQALALWRQSLESGQILSGHEPLVVPKPDPSPAPKPNPQRSDDHEWIPLSVLEPTPGDPPPVEITFPDGSCVITKYWKDTMIEVVRWIVDNEHLSPSLCPVQSARSNVVATSPVHPSGSTFRSPFQIGSLYMETHGYITVLLQRTRTVIDRVGLDSAQFKLRFD